MNIPPEEQLKFLETEYTDAVKSYSEFCLYNQDRTKEGGFILRSFEFQQKIQALQQSIRLFKQHILNIST